LKRRGRPVAGWPFRFFIVRAAAKFVPQRGIQLSQDSNRLWWIKETACSTLGMRTPQRKETSLATDYAKLSENLSSFYNFTDKVVLFIGAGGRQLLDPATRTKKLIAIDRDAQALQPLKSKIMAQGLKDLVEVIGGSFEEITANGDTIYFEFCLHEMDDPEKALLHGKSLAADIIVYDHSSGSEWIYYGAEDDKVARSTAAMHRFGIRRGQTFEAEQRFTSFAELLAKMSPQGPLAIERIQRFAGAADIVIPMSYELNLL
jgi:hypothetical protein